MNFALWALIMFIASKHDYFVYIIPIWRIVLNIFIVFWVSKPGQDDTSNKEFWIITREIILVASFYNDLIFLSPSLTQTQLVHTPIFLIT